MTQRLYYTDAYTHTFDAKVTEILPLNGDGQIGLVLEKTYLYPTSGGQPHDVGHLGGMRLRDVRVRQTDEAVIHLVEPADPVPTVGTSITCQVDWPRRFDHMQQHSGQHILSRAFIELCGAETVGFHLGVERCTIDVDRLDLGDSEVAAVEGLANQIIADNRPIEVRFVSQAEADRLPLRKRPPIKGDEMRLVDIVDFDLCACGGTHVARTGEIGLLKILRTERRKNKGLRIEFLCGQRGIDDYRHKHEVVQGLMKLASTRSELLADAYVKQKEENKRLSRTLKVVKGKWLALEAEKMADRFEPAGPYALLTTSFAHGTVNMGDMRQLAAKLTAEPNRIVLFGICGEQGSLLFKRSDDVDRHMGELIAAALPLLGKENGSGGGGADLAQGGGFSATEGQMSAMFASLREKIP